MAHTKIDYARLFDITPTPLMVVDHDLRYITMNESYLVVTGRRREDLVGQYLFDEFPETAERQAILEESFRRALAGEANSIDRFVFAIAGPDGVYKDFWWDCEQLPITDVNGTIIGAMQRTQDVTRQVEVERMRDAISLEYDHRVRNILTKVSAIARRTARTSTSIQQFVEDFDPRISAMARAHKLLVHGGWERLGLSELVSSELQPYEAARASQIEIRGPNLALSSRVAQALGMALHELATNAVKHGALAGTIGKLVVEWTLGDNGALHFEWRETGLSGLTAAKTSGFGSTIIDHILPGETAGTVTRIVAETGLTCTIDIPDPART